MRTVTRLFLIGCLACLIAGPVLATPVVTHASPTVAAPGAEGRSTATNVLPWLAIPAAFGAIRIKDTGSLAKKFVNRATSAAPDYTTGVQASGSDWEQNTKAAEDNYKTAVVQAANDGRFGRGVAAAGQAKFVQRATTLGAQRYPTGVGAAEGDWAKGTQPYLDALKSMELPPRRPKGDPGNAARAQAVAQKLRAMRVAK